MKNPYLKMKFICILLILHLLVSCSSNQEEQSKVDVFEIRNIGLLATSEYTIGKVIELKDEAEWYKFGDRNILISCKAKVKAGVDLSQISKNDIEVKGKNIKITLPYPSIISFDMDPNTIHTEVQDINGFRRQFNQEEKNEILAQGEESIKKQLNETSILLSAKHNTEIFIENFYKELAYEHVTIVFKKPYTQEITTP